MNNKFLHFSVDDVIDCFEDIFVNNYDSIFQNSFYWIGKHYMMKVG